MSAHGPRLNMTITVPVTLRHWVVNDMSRVTDGPVCVKNPHPPARGSVR